MTDSNDYKVFEDKPPLVGIDTVLETDNGKEEPPLRIASLQGTEGISIPYTYEVTLFSNAEEFGYIDPSELIGTP